MKDNRHPICIRAREARIAAGFGTQKDMADAMEMELHAYNKYETRSPITSEHLPKFIKVTNVRPEWLLTGDGEMRGDPSDNWFKLFSKFTSPQDRERLEQAARLMFPDKFEEE
jgi:Ser/Thr protein kinase RdoA (MazF antagonist)